MTVGAKICGINSRAALEAAVAGGAEFVGFIFYPPSPRSVTPAEAAALAAIAGTRAVRTGLFVDPDDRLIDGVLADVPLDLIQLHGKESPERVRSLRRRTGRLVKKALRSGSAADGGAAEAYLEAADWLMFDALPPETMKNALPGGNAVAFDWALLSGRAWPLPWMLAGGINSNNVADAVRLSGARVVDTSSGVEDAPGRKNPDKIKAFLDAVAAL